MARSPEARREIEIIPVKMPNRPDWSRRPLPVTLPIPDKFPERIKTPEPEKEPVPVPMTRP